jgi:hypothetical protein
LYYVLHFKEEEEDINEDIGYGVDEYSVVDGLVDLLHSQGCSVSVSLGWVSGRDRIAYRSKSSAPLGVSGTNKRWVAR